MNQRMSKELAKLQYTIQREVDDFNALMTIGLYKESSEGGIYICTYLKDPRYVYIGRTVNFYNRWYNQHEKQLINNTHCGYFQEFFNQNNCTISDFKWAILEKLPPNDIETMKAHERFWIKKYNEDPRYILLNSQKY